MSRHLLFVAAILASSFLIFLVQPMVGKRILPWFGGTPSVWTLCLAFYQTTLFAGYAYAHLLIRFASARAQIFVHVCFVLAALAVLPVLPDKTLLSADSTHPSLVILMMLGSTVALPFMMLASTGPLVQVWFSRAYPNRSPYPLYAVSNIGSFAALLAYPFVLEPRMSLSMTGQLWSAAFCATAVAVLACAYVARSSERTQDGSDLGGSDHEKISADANAASEAAGDGVVPSPISVVLWILLAGAAVVLLMGVTNSVSLDIASVPFLWILPLATYLLTFILCFAAERNYRPTPLVILTLSTALMTIGVHFVNDVIAATFGDEVAASVFAFLRSAVIQVPAYCAMLFGGCMIMHGELYRLRPPARWLTGFYLCVSGGGALGGLFVGLLAPILFSGYFETRIGLGLTIVLFLVIRALREREETDPEEASPGLLNRFNWRVAAPLAIVVAIYSLRPPPIDEETIVHNERSFFGVLQVIEKNQGDVLERHLMSGITLHGVEFFGERQRPLPTTYFGRATGVATAFASFPPGKPVKVGVIGLGIGTLSAYGRPGDSFRYYEIDPAVAHIAGETGYFTFLKQSMARVAIVVGDARLEIEREQQQTGSQGFDLLVIDAFNSDAIPIHLLTAEAFALYKKALAPNGLLAAHISNRHFDLLPLVARAGLEVNLSALDLRTGAAPGFQSLNAHWVVLSEHPKRLTRLADVMRRRTQQMGLPETHAKIDFPISADLDDVALWTDDYSDLVSALRD